MRRFFSLFLMLLAGYPAHAQQVDQVSVVDGNFVFNFGSAAAMAQSFTVGLPGTMVGIEVELSNFDSNTEDLFFSVVRAPGGVPSTAPGDLLFSATIPDSDVPDTRTSILIPVDVAVQPGDQLAFVLDANEDPISTFNTYSVYAQGGNPYPEGDAYRFGGSLQSADLGFRTFVIVGPADPIPALSPIGLGILTVVLLLLGLNTFRRRSRHV